MTKVIDKKNRKLPEWARWYDILKIAEITGYEEGTVYKMLIGERKIDPIKQAVEEYCDTQAKSLENLKKKFLAA